MTWLDNCANLECRKPVPVDNESGYCTQCEDMDYRFMEGADDCMDSEYEYEQRQQDNYFNL